MTPSILWLLAKNWPLLLVRGILSLLFGILVLLWPELPLEILWISWGAYMGADGLLALSASVRGEGPAPRLGLALHGLFEIGLAVYSLTDLPQSALTLLIVIACWCIFRGIWELGMALLLRKELDDGCWLILPGGFSLIFGALLLIRPGAGALAVATLVALCCQLLGFVGILLALQWRHFKDP
ncbi:uncharacterized membrane protein HdeD (DUF308 family) [Haloferula luteola]|uniref:Uncharacterized membrane protein HdeD (DUF308 family) n=1 Tax=Haloferula luteola TaxID=595692 RepID=A0A840V308_9BACT|nr:DUF308 domain-containing protein [Haloferula luteola]MBB5351863.1 uncharacterized membrane protein HdeD (DUF308 family) [Haloferula luteola]